MSAARACSAAVTPLRGEPRADAEQVSQVLAGEPLTVVAADGGWALVRTAYGYPGWLPAAALDRAPDPAWSAPVAAGDAVAAARAHLGAPYLWGGMTAAGIDCSGLVHVAHRAVGRLVPRDADQQEAAGRPLAAGEERHGDLVLYGPRIADHVAFWLGDGMILHASDAAGVHRVVEEREPELLRRRLRRLVRL